MSAESTPYERQWHRSDVDFAPYVAYVNIDSEMLGELGNCVIGRRSSLRRSSWVTYFRRPRWHTSTSESTPRVVMVEASPCLCFGFFWASRQISSHVVWKFNKQDKYWLRRSAVRICVVFCWNATLYLHITSSGEQRAAWLAEAWGLVTLKQHLWKTTASMMAGLVSPAIFLLSSSSSSFLGRGLPELGISSGYSNLTRSYVSEGGGNVLLGVVKARKTQGQHKT